MAQAEEELEVVAPALLLLLVQAVAVDVVVVVRDCVGRVGGERVRCRRVRANRNVAN